MTTQAVPLACVIGRSVGYSKSPKIFAHWLADINISGHYIPINVADDDLAETLKMLTKLGFKGANVTIPYKETVLSLSDHVSDHAKSIGAANTLTFGEDGQIYADNTDGYGFMENLTRSAPEWDATGGPAVVLGAGGASRAVIAALLNQGVPEIRLTNRTRQRADDLKRHFGDRVSVIDWSDANHGLADASVLVNTTSLGMINADPMSLSLDHLPMKAVVTDIVYMPLMTDLLVQAKARGNFVVDGLGMLLYQAVPGFERWFGATPIVDVKLREMMLR